MIGIRESHSHSIQDCISAYRGEMTVFLSFLLLIMLSFSSGICYVSVLNTHKGITRIDTDHALFSTFAGYHRQLFEAYHLMAFYAADNIRYTDFLQTLDHFDCSHSDHKLYEWQLITDENGAAFAEQTAAYVEAKYGLTAAKQLENTRPEWEERTSLAEQTETENKRQHDTFGKSEPSSAPPSDDTADETETNKQKEQASVDLHTLTDLTRPGMLASYVVRSDILKNIRTAEHPQFLSAGQSTHGLGTFQRRKHIALLPPQTVLTMYASDHFLCLSDPDESHRPLYCQLEYLLCGKKSDEENLEETLKRLFFMRLAANITTLYQDPQKQNEANAYAITLASLLLMPEASEAIKNVILLAWASGESIIDLRSLADGYKIPVSKTASQWSLSLPELLTLPSTVDTKRGLALNEGLSYKDYVNGLLLLSSPDPTCVRALDVIDICIRKKDTSFHLDHCITKVRIHSSAYISPLISYKFPTYFGYE